MKFLWIDKYWSQQDSVEKLDPIRNRSSNYMSGLTVYVAISYRSKRFTVRQLRSHAFIRRLQSVSDNRVDLFDSFPVGMRRVAYVNVRGWRKRLWPQTHHVGLVPVSRLDSMYWKASPLRCPTASAADDLHIVSPVSGDVNVRRCRQFGCLVLFWLLSAVMRCRAAIWHQVLDAADPRPQLVGNCQCAEKMLMCS